MQQTGNMHIKQISLTRMPQAKRPLATRTSGYKDTIKMYLTEMRREDKDEAQIAQDMV
jgi:hypothetical protein